VVSFYVLSNCAAISDSLHDEHRKAVTYKSPNSNLVSAANYRVNRMQYPCLV